MEIQASKRELEALLVGCAIGEQVIRADESETAEIDSKILNQWVTIISEKIQDLDDE